KQGLPELVLAVGNATLAVHAKAQARNVRTRFQQRGERVAAVRRVGFRRQTGDSVVRVRIGPFIGVRPEREIELQAALDGFVADEPQRVQVAIAFAGCSTIAVGTISGSTVESAYAARSANSSTA